MSFFPVLAFIFHFRSKTRGIAEKQLMLICIVLKNKRITMLQICYLRRGSLYGQFCWGLFTLGIKICQHTNFLMWPNVFAFSKKFKVSENIKERAISPLNADVFLAYIKLWTGEICSSPTQIFQAFTATSCQRTIFIHISKTLEACHHSGNLWGPNQRPLKISQLTSLVRSSLPTQATPVAHLIPLLQVKTREKNHMKSGVRMRNRC